MKLFVSLIPLVLSANSSYKYEGCRDVLVDHNVNTCFTDDCIKNRVETFYTCMDMEIPTAPAFDPEEIKECLYHFMLGILLK